MPGPKSEANPYSSGTTLLYVAVLAAILFAMGWVGLHPKLTDRVAVWLQVMVLMAAFAVIAGRGITGYWRGILIDSRNKMSLSRLQLLVWSLVVLSALFAAVMTNVALGSTTPLNIDVPAQLWIALGISTASAVGSPLVLASKRGIEPSDKQRQSGKEKLKAMGRTDIDKDRTDVVVQNTEPSAARWADLLMGDEIGNAAAIDVGKLQMMFFTFILAVGYGAAIAGMLEGTELVDKLPDVDEGMNVLLGISHTGYLAAKASPHSEEAPNSD